MKRGWAFGVLAGLLLGLGLGCGGGGDKSGAPTKMVDAPKEAPVPIGVTPKKEGN